MSKTRRTLLTLLALALLRWPVDVLLHAVLPDAAVDPIPQCVVGMLLSALLLGLPAWLLRPWTSDRLVQSKSLWWGMMAAVCAAVLVRTVMTPVDAVWQRLMHLVPDAMPVPENLPVALLCVVAMVIVPAVTEEAFFRGALLTGLLDGSRRMTAILLASVAFTLMHRSPAHLPSLLVLSALLALLMLHSGSIAVPITAHLVYNLTALYWGQIPLWVAGFCGAGLTELMLQMWGQPKFAHQPMKWQDGLIAAAAIGVLAAVYFV